MAEDYRSAYEVATERVWAKWYLEVGNKREREGTAIQEEDSDGHGGVEKEQKEIYDQDERAGKRQKKQESGGYVQLRGTHEESEAPRLGAEQEELGAFHFDEAAWTDFGREQGPSANFQFADTGMPFRFKG